MEAAAAASGPRGCKRPGGHELHRGAVRRAEVLQTIVIRSASFGGLLLWLRRSERTGTSLMA